MTMKPFGELMDRKTALDIIEKNIKKIDRVEKLPLIETAGRVIATEVRARFNVPPFDRASMDGYAVKAADTTKATKSNPVQLILVGVQYTGDQFKGEVVEGECIEIATGSPMPPGSDSVVMVEYTSREGGVVNIFRPVKAGDNLAFEGEDMIEGDLVVKAGTLLNPGHVGAMAALGYEKVEVYEKPVVAIYSSGPEIIPQGKKLEPGQIYDVNSFTLSSVIRMNGGSPLKRGIIGDDEESIAAAIEDALRFDIAVFSGGSSVGTMDNFSKVIADMGEVFFHGLSVKPGKPTLFGEVDRTPVFGMPGYPTSCLNNAYVFLAPALRKVARLPPLGLKRLKVPIGHKIVSRSDREHFMTVKFVDGKAHRVYKASGDITSMSEAEGYILLPVGEKVIEEGEMVEVILYG